jgi:myo-inositol-1(or 4)-monophosphatase
LTSSSPSSAETLERIHAALEAAREVLNRFTPGAIEAQYKVGTDPVTEADHAVDAVLKKNLLRAGEGWLSEETVDDFTRLDKRRVWVVDPLDGTREFVHSRGWRNLQSGNRRTHPRFARHGRYL